MHIIHIEKENAALNHCFIFCHDRVFEPSQPVFICSKSTMETPEQFVKSFKRRSGTFIVNFEQISPIVLVIPLLTLKKSIPAVMPQER